MNTFIPPAREQKITDEDNELLELWRAARDSSSDEVAVKTYASMYARVQLNRVAQEYYKKGNASLAANIQDRADRIGALQ